MIERVAVAITYTALGACAGSFAGTAALRWAGGESAIAGRSRCDGCGALLSFWRTVPLISYAVAGGVCGACRWPIDLAHPLAETSGALAGLSAGLVEPRTAPAFALMVAGGLIGGAIADLRVRRLPGAVWTAIGAGGVAIAASKGVPALSGGLLTAAIVFVTLDFARAYFERAWGREGLRCGDVKLMSALALWLGPATPFAMGLAAAAGAISILYEKQAGRRITTMPAIAAAGWVVGLIHDAGGLAWLS